MEENASGKTGITYQENGKEDRGRTKLPGVIISLARLLVKNADRQAEVTGQGCRLTPRVHSLLRGTS